MMFMISIHFTPQAVNRYCKNRKLIATKGLLRVMFASGQNKKYFDQTCSHITLLNYSKDFIYEKFADILGVSTHICIHITKNNDCIDSQIREVESWFSKQYKYLTDPYKVNIKNIKVIFSQNAHFTFVG